MQNVLTRSEIDAIARFLGIDREDVEAVGFVAWLRRRHTARAR